MNNLYINSLFIFILACPLAAFSDPKQAPPETRPPEMPNPCSDFGAELCSYITLISTTSIILKKDREKVSLLINSFEKTVARISDLMKRCAEKDPVSCSELNKLQLKLKNNQNIAVQPVASNHDVSYPYVR